jgi:hypothetical protein
MSFLSPTRAVVGLVAAACAFTPFLAPAVASSAPPREHRSASNERAVFPDDTGQIPFPEFARRYAVPGTPTDAGTPQQFALVNVEFLNCVDADPAAPIAGSVRQWTCDGAPWQNLTTRVTGAVSYLATNDGLVLTGPGQDDQRNGAPVVRLPIEGDTGPNQWWSFHDDGTIRSTANSRCLEADPTRPGDPQPLQVWDCNGAQWQHWMVRPIS